MAFEETTVGGAVLVKADGRIDMSNADAFKDALVSAVSTAKRAVIVDLDGVDYISSAGLRALTIALRAAKDAGKTFAVAALTPLVLEIFTISRFNRLFPVYGAVQEALEAMAPHEHGAARMKITFWGTRGSLPAPLGGGAVRRKLVNALVKAAGANLDTPEKAEYFCDTALSFPEQATFGGNTSCVQVDAGGPDYLLCDLGSGVREFSLAALGRHGPGKPQTYHVLVSHVHWDHIMGFPFFVPAFIPGNKIRIYSCHPHFEQAIRNQNHAPCFPVEFSALSASIEFIALEPEKPYEIAGCTVTGMAQLHGGEFVRLPHRGRRADGDLHHRRRIQAGGHRPHGAHRGVLQGRRRGDLRFHVFAGRIHLGEGGLGPLQQHHGRRALPHGGGQASLPVPP